ncbi:hypothetical protein CPB84DRAFT_1081184 [Gymnopilus junonius]|uniref:Uncharacterized protein n=1 Tax=Gymnopilus junonius TaxID=109634 RepID=A0A9P5TUA1_GYMJU|nr:hypothetical protein CPB84DRAFT_1081184 [Gymnopilus junonius]
MSSSDSLFNTLPHHVQNAIDDAFTNTVISNDAQSHQRKSERPQAAGGFIVEPPGGGFLSNTVTDSNTEPDVSKILFDLIPSALQRLDLPPDDEEVLSVFNNAASGWTAVSLGVAYADPQAKYVSRDDWRSVCAVLLEYHTGESDEQNNTSQIEEDGVFPSDDYAEEQSSDNSMDDSSDEYQEGNSPSRVRHTKKSRGKNHAKSSGLLSTNPTSRQRQTCLDAFALFFPDVPPEFLEGQKIKIADLQRVSKLLGEKIKGDEMLEMLEMFSTSADKAMDINSFTRMMITAKLA